METMNRSKELQSAVIFFTVRQLFFSKKLWFLDEYSPLKAKYNGITWVKRYSWLGFPLFVIEGCRFSLFLHPRCSVFKANQATDLLLHLHPAATVLAVRVSGHP